MLLYHKGSRKGRVHYVFLLLSEENLQEMADIIDTCASIIGNNANKCITIFSEEKEVGDMLMKLLQPEVRKDLKDRQDSKYPCCIFGFPLEFLRESVEEMLGDVAYEDANATTELPFWNGKNKPVLNRRIKSLTDLEVYLPKPKLSSSLKEINEARDNFYKGEVIKQINLDNRDDIERTLATDLTQRIEQSLRRLSAESPEDTTCVEVVSLSYESGSGATTLVRRVLWDKRYLNRCAVVKSINDNTYHQIQELQIFGYETIDRGVVPPVLILVDNEPEHDFDNLRDKLSEKNTKCVLLKTIPIAITLEKKSDDDCLNLGTLDEEEIQRVKRTLANLKNIDDKEKYAAVEKVQDEKRFIWLGLQLFGQQYKHIKKRLSEHINNIISHNVTDQLKDAYKMILHFCCLLDYYSKGRSIYPHPCIADILYSHEDLNRDDVNQMKKIHDKFGGLLLEDYSYADGYRGWRPAHFLVAELVHKEMDFVETAKLLVRKMNSGTTYAKTYLTNNTVDVFLNREKISESSPQNISDTDFFLDGISVEDEFDSLKVQTKYSALIMAAMALNETFPSIALDLLVTLIENVLTTQHKSRVWQQIARVFAYEIRMLDISEQSIKPLVKRINEILQLSGRSLNSSATNGFAIAHQVIDHAINLQKSFVNHLVTKATFFKVELSSLHEHAKDITTNEESKQVMKEAISTTKKGIQAYDNALEKSPLHAMVGKTETIILLLQIFKTHHCFTQSDMGPDESFKNYIIFGEHPDALKETLTEDDLNYFLSLANKFVQYLNELFEEIKFRKSRYGKENKQDLINSKKKAMAVRKQFYQVTQRNRRIVGYDSNEEDIFAKQNNERIVHNLVCKENIVQDLLYDYEETAFSTWKKLPDAVIARIYSTLNVAISKGPVSQQSMLICARAALRENVKVDELLNHILLWYKHFPKSVWCHMFKYMIHFPVPSGTLKSNVQMVKQSADFCKKSGPHERYRKSGAEYLLGRGVGLNIILSSHKVSLDRVGHKSDFWRSLELYEKLERLRGEKVLGKKGVLSYRGIEIMFDNDRYPKESRDELWFCLGFTLNGPYAYDPIDEDTYRKMEADFLRLKKKENGASKTSVSSQESRGEVKNAWQCKKQGSSMAAQPVLDRKTSQSGGRRKERANNKTIKPNSETEMTGFPEETKHTTQCITEGEWKSNPQLEIRRRAEEGHQQTFKPKWMDTEGKIHHGAMVKEAPKSFVCRTHRSNNTRIGKCWFAHPWTGDYVQETVCYVCTKSDQQWCVGKDNEHSHSIYKLGNYQNESGEIWRLQQSK
jgi:hypothetical protein